MADIFVPEDFAAWQIHLRRMFHRRPEIGWCEYWTTSALASECRKMGLAPLVGREIMEDEGRLGLPDAGTRADAAKAALQETQKLSGYEKQADDMRENYADRLEILQPVLENESVYDGFKVNADYYIYDKLSEDEVVEKLYEAIY